MAFSPTRLPLLDKSLELCDLANRFAVLTPLNILGLGPCKHIHTHASGTPTGAPQIKKYGYIGHSLQITIKF